MSQVVAYARDLLSKEVVVHADLSNFDERVELWVCRVDRSLGRIETASANLLEWCGADVMRTRRARDLVQLWSDVHEAGLSEVAEVARMASYRVLFSDPSKDPQRLYPRLSKLLNRVDRLVIDGVSKIGLRKALVQLFAVKQPVAAALGDFGALLPMGRSRFVGTVLQPVPARDEGVLISRDVEVVKALAHVATMLNTRVASYLASSPGMGKTHFVWDLSVALANPDDERYAQAAGHLGISAWPNIVPSLRRTRLCIVSFNGACMWGRSDLGCLAMDHRLAIFLPIYLRMLWYLRCVDSRCWDDFCGDVKALLDVGATTVQGVIEEALRALREQPTILVVEELSKVSKDVFRHTWQSPAEAACSFEDVEPQEFEVSLMDAYRHELCTCTRFENTALLFTAVSFGMMYSDINEDAEDSAELDSRIADVVRQTGDPSVVERLLLSSSTSSRRGSPYFLLNAVEIGILDTEILAGSPVILVAALHICEVDSQLPIIQGDLSKRYFKGWDDLFSTGVLSCGLQGTSGTYKNPCIPPLYLVALLERWGPWQTEVALPGAGPAATDAIYMRGIMHALKELFHTYDGKGDASSVWESYYSDGPRPLLDQERFNALPDSMIVVDEGDLVDISGILALQAADLLRTSFKCKHSQVGGDYIKFLRRSGAVEGLKNEELVWEEWRTKTVLVVETNLKIAKNPSTRLTPEESRMVIIIGAENHLDVYGRSLSGFIADAPTLFAATVAKRSGKKRRV
ncbi:hypothetical protein I4F81_005280 [Pyropia yezoensis]|uniref:Uncharacterized protein n=1 Tax=Pyropia yezoensis TaxID=2788 RepID=A0ACC3BYQ7_PYRYE|nr:hypothetical protein I4F81_005280 [Neopyropia yezoensis]